MKKFILTFLLLVVLLIGSIGYFVIHSLNADAYRQQVITALSDLTGRTITASDKTSFKWFPMPTLVLNDFALSNQPGSSQKNMLTADSVEIQIEWESLLKTPFVIKHVALNKPILHLERLESNRANWDLPFFSAPDAMLDDSQFLGSLQKTSTKIDQLEITAGSIFYTNKITNQSLQIKNVQGTFNIDSVKGPYTFNGTGRLDNNQFSLKIKTDKLVNDMPCKISATLTEKNSALSLDFNGEIFPSDPKKILVGDAAFSTENPQPLLAQLGIGVLNETFKKPTVGSFSVDITPIEDKLNNLIVRFGNDDNAFAMTTTLSYTPPLNNNPAIYRGQIAFNSLSFNEFKPYFNMLNWNMVNGTQKDIPLIETKINIPEFIMPNGTIKNVEADISLNNGLLSITAGRAILPGNMSVVFRANSGIQDKIPYLLSHVKGKTSNAKEFLNFIGLPPSSDATKNTPTDEATAIRPFPVKEVLVDTQITWTPTFISMDLSSLDLDTTHANGTLSFDPKNLKKAIANLTIKNLNLDTYTGWTNKEQKIPLKELPKQLASSLQQATFLSQANIIFDTTLEAFTWHNLPVTNAKIAGTVKDGTLTISNAEFQGVATAALKLTGKASGLGTSGALVNNIAFSFSADQLPLLLGRAGISAQLPLITQANAVKASGSINNNNSAWKTNVQAQLSDATFKIDGDIAVVNDAPHYKDVRFNITHPNFHKFLDLLQLSTTPVKNLNGALRAQGLINGSQEELTLKDAEISVGTQKLNGSMHFQKGDTKKLDLIATSAFIEADRFIVQNDLIVDKNHRLSSKPFDFSKWDNWDISVDIGTNRLTYKTMDLSNARIKATLKDKVFALKELSGVNHGNETARFDLSGSLSYVTTPVLKADFKLADLVVRPDFMIVNKFSYGNGKANLSGSIDTTGNSIADMAQNLNGNGQLNLTNGQFLGMDLAKIPALVKQATDENMSQQDFDTQINRLLTLGKTPINSASGAFTIAKGVVRLMDMVIQTPSAVAAPSQIVWNIADNIVNITMPFALTSLKEYPPIVVSVDVGEKGSAYTPDYTALSGTIANEVKQDLDAKQNARKQAAIRAAMQKAVDQENAVKQAINDANKTVREISQELYGITDEQVGILMQNATDALNIVNQLAIKENRTSQQNDTILEQARLAILKANEAKQVAGQTAGDYRQTVAGIEKRALQMVQKMQQMEQTLPHIAIIPKLTNTAKQNLNLIQSARRRLNESDLNGQTIALNEASTAYQAIESAYENVMRFDISGVVYTPASSARTSGVRGTIARQ